MLSDDGGVDNPGALMEDEEAVNNHGSSSPVAIFSESASQPSAINNFDGTSKTTGDDATKDYFGGDTTEDGLTMEEEDAEEVETMSGQNATSGSRRSTNEEGNNSAASSKELSSESSNESNGHDNTFGKEEMTKDLPGDEEEGREHDDFTMVSSGNANHDESSTLVNNNSNHQQFLSFLPSSKQSSSTNVAFPTRSSSRNEKQDDYVKKGAHVKALLASVMQAVADGFAHSNKATVEDGSSDNNNSGSGSNNGSDECGAEKKLSKKTAEDFVHMQELAQTKSEECIALKRVSYCLVFNATFIEFISCFVYSLLSLYILYYSTETR